MRAQGVLRLIKDQDQTREERGRKMTVGTLVPELCHLLSKRRAAPRVKPYIKSSEKHMQKGMGLGKHVPFRKAEPSQALETGFTTSETPR